MNSELVINLVESAVACTNSSSALPAVCQADESSQCYSLASISYHGDVTPSVAIKRLGHRGKDQSWVAGFDLLNGHWTQPTR
jgi:hypothetical protein